MFSFFCPSYKVGLAVFDFIGDMEQLRQIDIQEAVDCRNYDAMFIASIASAAEA